MGTTGRTALRHQANSALGWSKGDKSAPFERALSPFDSVGPLHSYLLLLTAHFKERAVPSTTGGEGKVTEGRGGEVVWQHPPAEGPQS